MPSIKIGNKPLKTPRITNTFRVHISQMSGDADAYNNEYFSFTDGSEALDFAMLAVRIKGAQKYGYGTDSTRELMSLLPVGPDYDPDTISEICGYDVTRDGCLAAVDSVSITYFDQHGVEFSCDLIED